MSDLSIHVEDFVERDSFAFLSIQLFYEDFHSVFDFDLLSACFDNCVHLVHLLFILILAIKVRHDRFNLFCAVAVSTVCNVSIIEASKRKING